MVANRRQQWLAATLIVLIIGVMVVKSMDDGDAPPPPAAAAPAPAARGRPAAAVNQVAELASVDVNLKALTRPRGQPADQGRNPFRFRPQAPPRQPDLPPRPAVRPGPVGLGNESAGPFIPPAPVGPPPPPPITLKCIGILEKVDGTKIAVLSDGRGTYHGVEGQEIAGRYKILRIGVESIEVSYIDGRGRQTIRLTGQ
jgi:hypothetical protein